MSKKRKPKTKPLRYFFYNGDLHKKVHINRPADVITAWNYPKHKVEKYSYSQVKREGEKAFTTMQVQKMIGRGRKTIDDAINGGHIPRPQMTYGLGGHQGNYAFYWSEKDIMGLHSYLQTVHRGRPRLDGLITPGNLPTASELRAIIRQGTVLYVKDTDGNFVPTWDAEKF